MSIRRFFSYLFAMSLVMSCVLILAQEGYSRAAEGPGPGSCLDDDGSDNVEKYVITLRKMEFSYDGGSSYVTIFEGSEDQDMASGGINEVLGSFFSGLPAPAGTVTHIRPTIQAQIVIRGSVESDGTTYYTQVDGSASAVGPAEDYVAQVNDGVDINDVDDVADFTISENETTVLQFQVDASNALCLHETQGEDLGIDPNPINVDLEQVS